MSLSKSFRILCRCLNTAASDSKTIRGGQSVSDSKWHSEVGSHVNHGQTIQKLLPDRVLPIVAELLIAGGLGATFAYLIDESLSKSNLEKAKIELLENLNRTSEEYWGGIMDEMINKNEEANKEIKLLMEKIKEEGRKMGFSID